MEAKSNSYFVKGVLIALAGAICFSTKAIFVKLAYRDSNIDAISLLALRMIFSLPFFVITAYASSVKSSNVKFTTKQWIQIAIVGCLGYYISSLLDFLGLQFVTAGIERLILFIYPTLALVMSAILFKEKVKPMQWLALIVTYAGLMLAFFSEVDLDFARNKDFLLGALFIFACAFTYAAYIVGSGKLIPLVGAAKFNSYAMSFACVGVLLHFFIQGNNSLLNLSVPVYSYGILMAILSTVIPSYLVTNAIKRIGADNAAIVGSVGPVSTIAMAYFFLQENVSILQLAGTVLILVGVLIIGKQKTARSNEPIVDSSIS